MLLEKAFAKMAGSYSALMGGAAARAWIAMTGCTDVRLFELDASTTLWDVVLMDLSPKGLRRGSWGKRLLKRGQPGHTGEEPLRGDRLFEELAEAESELAFCVTEEAEGSGERYALIATLPAGVEVWRLEGDGRAQLVTTVANGAPVPPLTLRPPRALCLIPWLALGAGCAAARGAPHCVRHQAAILWAAPAVDFK